MKLITEKMGDVAVIRLSVTSLDVANVAAFKEAMAPIVERESKIVLDLASLEFIDSSGLGALLSCLRKLCGKGGDLKLCSLSNAVRTVFELVRMHRVVDITADRNEAILRFT